LAQRGTDGHTQYKYRNGKGAMKRFRAAAFAGVDVGGGAVAAHVRREQLHQNHVADGIDAAGDERQYQRQPGFFADFRSLLVGHIASEEIAFSTSSPLPCTRGRGVGVRGKSFTLTPTPLPRVQGRGEIIRDVRLRNGKSHAPSRAARRDSNSVRVNPRMRNRLARLVDPLINSTCE